MVRNRTQAVIRFVTSACMKVAVPERPCLFSRETEEERMGWGKSRGGSGRGEEAEETAAWM